MKLVKAMFLGGLLAMVVLSQYSIYDHKQSIRILTDQLRTEHQALQQCQSNYWYVTNFFAHIGDAGK